jgi:hypothetical protein
MAAGALMIRPQFGDFFASRLAYIDEVIDMRFRHHAMHFDQVFKVKDVKAAYTEVTGLTGFGLFTEKEEGASVNYDQMRQGFDKRFTQTIYGSGFQLSIEIQHFDLDSKFQDATEKLARAGEVSAETSVWSVLNNAFSTETTPDGLSLINSAHLLAGGGTFSNSISGDLTIGTLEDSLNRFSDFVDDRSLLIAVQPRTLIIPPEMRFYAAMWLGSELNPDTGNLGGGLDGVTWGSGVGGGVAAVNSINPMRNAGLSYFVSPYLTDADAWFLMGDKEDSPLRVFWGIRPTPDHAIDFDTGNAKTKLIYSIAYGAVDWRPLVGSSG